MNKHARERRDAIVLHLVIVPLAIVWLFPIWFMVVFATMPENAIFSPDILLVPSTEFLNNFRELEEDAGFLRTIFNSVLVAVIYTALSVLLTSMAGWALARYRFAGRGAVAALVLGTMTLPYFVVVIPQFIMVARDFNLINTWFALIVPPLFNSLGVLFMRQAFLMLPSELFDAARVEGVSEWKIFRYVAMPMAAPTIAALSIVLFLFSWNNYLWPLLIATRPDMMTAPVALGSLIGVTRVSWGSIMVGSVLLTVPMLILFIALQRYFISGITSGAVK
ncbi:MULTISPECIES: carbohydrate ABC transporter permease [unclassified Roseitalea]|uniref:carbohydrate ABC transporter permease n=1 Tax=unclassified Roseitalea TaxID=2639107 RepID=UPI00274000C3|nr:MULTISPECIES: carbohydrate ABC transporter permease [unclassified Roseitalea]